MALTYKRPLTYNMADPVRRSTQTPVPTAAVREAAAPRQRVQFAPATDFVTTLDAPNDSDTDVEAAHLPQSFRHGLPRSSLEPGTTNLLYPPSHLFLDPPLGEGEPQTRETPLQVAARLQHAVDDNQKVLAELKAVLWQKATGQERHPDVAAVPAETAKKQ